MKVNTVTVTANGTADFLPESIAAGGGVVAAVGAKSDLSTNISTLASIGENVQIPNSTEEQLTRPASLNVSSTFDQDVDASADSYSIALASGAGAGISNVITTKTDISIGENATISTDNIFLVARNSLEKNRYKDGSNLRSGSAAIVTFLFC